MTVGKGERVSTARTLVDTVRSLRSDASPATILEALTTFRVGCSLTMQFRLEH